MLTLYTIDLEDPHGDPLSRGMDPAFTFRVSGFEPSSVSSQDIVRCLTVSVAQTGLQNRLQFEIIWINSTTFLVASEKDHANVVVNSLIRHFGERSDIVSLERHLEDKREQEQEESQKESATGETASAPVTVNRGIGGLWGNLMGLMGRGKHRIDGGTSEGTEERQRKRRRLEN